MFFVSNKKGPCPPFVFYYCKLFEDELLEDAFNDKRL